MATRKTRKQLDEEMGGVPPEDAAELSLDEELAEEEIPAEEAEALPLTEESSLAQDDESLEAEEEDENAAVEPLPESSRTLIKTVLESLLFSANGPLGLRAMLGPVREIHPSMNSRTLRSLLEELRDELRERGRGIRIGEVAGGYQLRTPSETAPYIKKLITRRPPRLTRATLESLAIVAYRQPVTRGEIDDIRGVDSGAVLKHLMEKRLIRILGRKEEVGRPLIYGTTKEFLEFFNLKDLKSLPTLKDFVELSEEHRAELGLDPPEALRQEHERGDLPGQDILRVDETDAYNPVGQDEVIEELSEALQELKQKDIVLRKVFPTRRAATAAAAAADDSGDEPLEPDGSDAFDKLAPDEMSAEFDENPDADDDGSEGEEAGG